MNKATRSDNARLLTTEQASKYIGMGRTNASQWLASIGARVVFSPKCVRYDRIVIDKALDEVRQAAGEAGNAV